MSIDRPAVRKLDDIRTLRALAHPLRVRLMELLAFHGPMTATRCAALVGESPSSCSFHLRMLAKYGLVEEAEGGTGRQRPWQISSLSHSWETGPETPVALRTAGEAVSRLFRERDQAALDGYLERQDEFEPAWRDAAIHANFGGWLTPDELAEIGEQLLDVWEPYLDRLRRGERPPGTRLVHMFAHGFPRSDALDLETTDDTSARTIPADSEDDDA